MAALPRERSNREAERGDQSMKIRVCPNCGGRLIADIMNNKVKVRCNACGQELGTFDRADRPVIISDDELFPLSSESRN